jgi:hypothetical protein
VDGGTQEGLLLKEEGQDRVEENNAEFVQIMRSVAVGLAKVRPYITTDMLQDWAEWEGISPKHPNAWGSLIRPGMAVDESGLKWEACGFQTSKRRSAHGRIIRRWRLTV